MKHVVMTAAALAMSGALAWTGSALAQSAGQTPRANTAATAVSTEDFVKQAALSDMLEVQAGQLAAKQAQRQEVKQFAEMMVKDHTKSSEELKAALKSGKISVTPPTSLDKEHQARLDQLRKAQGNQFDQAYMKQQVSAHQQALKLHQSYGQNGKDQALKSMAQKTAKVVEKHLQQAQSIEKSLRPAMGQGAEIEKR